MRCAPRAPSVPGMTLSRTTRTINLAAVLVPFVAVLVAIPLLWNQAVTWFDLTVMLVLYLIAGFGITVGYHRLLTHNAFKTHPVLRYLWAIAGSTGVQNPPIIWVADHRKHHAHADEEGDPHSPHVGGGEGFRGLVHAHMGWLYSPNTEKPTPKIHARELVEDPIMVKISKAFPLIVLVNVLIVPFVAGYLYYGTVLGGLQTYLWAGLVRVFLLHHVTWSINSLCHYAGSRRFAVEDHSTNVGWLAIPSLGECWHNNHHAFPRAAAHGMRWYEIDLSAILIKVMVRLRIASKPVYISRERQAAKAAERPRERQAVGA